MRKFLQIFFVVVMLACTAVFIGHVPASTLLNRSIETARDDLEHEQKLLRKQVEVDHVRVLEEIRAYQDELDDLLSPELDELWRYEQTIKTLKNEKSELQSEITSKKAEKEALEELLRNPGKEVPETKVPETKAPETEEPVTETQETETQETEAE